MLHCLRLIKPNFASNNLNENPKKKIQFISFRRASERSFSCFLPARLWPTIFHDSQNFVIIIDGYENVEGFEGVGDAHAFSKAEGSKV